MRAKPRAGTLAAAGVFYAVATAVFTWPLVTRLDSGMPDLWDAKLNAWIFHWDFHQIFRDPLHLFDANIFYPARYALAFSENLFGASFFGFPLYAAGASSLLAYNVLFLLGMWLSAMAAWALAREVTGEGMASLLAGVVYAFVPWRLAQLPHVQFQWGAFLALALLFLLRYLQSEARRDLTLFCGCFAWNALCNVHYALFAGLMALAVVGFETVALGWIKMRRRVARVALAAAAAGIVVLPFYIPYQKASELYGMRRSWGEIEAFSGRPIDFLTAGPQNKLYAPLTQKWAQPEGDFFPGLSVVLLAVLAVSFLWETRLPRARRPETEPHPRLLRALDVIVAVLLLLWFAATIAGGLTIGPLSIGDPGRVLVLATGLLLARLTLAFPRWSRFADLGDFFRRRLTSRRASMLVLTALVGIVVALGMHTPYYRFLARSFGTIFRAIRVPSRGIVLFDLGIGVLAAWGLALRTRRFSRAARIVATALALAAVTFEYRAFPIEIKDVDPAPAAAYRWLGRAAFSGAIVHWPMATDPDVEHTFRSTAHWKPIVNGYSGFGPPHYHELAAVLAQRPIPAAVWERMEQLGATVLVFHPHEITGNDDRLAHVNALLAALHAGKCVALGSFAAGASRDYVFRLAGAAPFPAEIPEAQPGAAAQDAVRRLGYLESTLHPPFGWVDSPKEGETVAPGAWGIGWALDDSGIQEVLMAADSAAPAPAGYGLPHPGPAAAYPAFPSAAKAGFGFFIPRLSPGQHTLVFTLIAKDGGKAEIRRMIRIR